MLTTIDRLIQSHRFLARRGLYPILLSSLLAIGLFASRAYLVVRLENSPAISLGHTLTYAFLVWNLFLAWIPFLSSLWAARIHQRFPSHWWYLLIPGALWLAFFPNAPYIVTDFLHLMPLILSPIFCIYEHARRFHSGTMLECSRSSPGPACF
jgi:hypothetical protein